MDVMYNTETCLEKNAYHIKLLNTYIQIHTHTHTGKTAFVLCLLNEKKKKIKKMY